MTKRKYLDEVRVDNTRVKRPNMDIETLYTPNLYPGSGHRNYFNSDIWIDYSGSGTNYYKSNGEQISREQAINTIKAGWKDPEVLKIDNLLQDIRFDKYRREEYKKYDKFGIPRRALATGGSIYIKPSHRGRLTELKARTGKSEAELYNDGNPAHKKMVVFARNARKWKH